MMEMSSKPASGRGIADDTQSIRVSSCGSNRCKTCAHMVVGNSFISNVNGRKYFVVSPQGNDLDCSSRNVIYVIFCTKCGVQYVGKTNQTLRCRLNNHRNGIKQLYDLYIYNHFNSDGHTVADLRIMPN